MIWRTWIGWFIVNGSVKTLKMIGSARMEVAIRIQIEELPEGVFLATSDELPGLVAQGEPSLKR